MASIRQIAQDVLYEARDGIAWIALYKEGRSWGAECFWGLFDKQEVFTPDDPEDVEQLHEILAVDPNAIFVNSYLHNLGPIDDEMTRDTLAKALRWQYDMQYFRLADTVIASTAEPENDSSAKADENPVASKDGAVALSTVPKSRVSFPTFRHTFRSFLRKNVRENRIKPPALLQVLTNTPPWNVRPRPPPGVSESHPERSV